MTATTTRQQGQPTTADLKPGTAAVIHIPQWLCNSENIVSRDLEGTIERMTERGVLFDGHALIAPADNCRRCGREIINPVSRLAGYGPICSDHLGIPRDFTEADIEQIKRDTQTVSHIRRWFPRSKIVVVPLREGDEVPPRKPVIRVAPSAMGLAITGDTFPYKDLIKSVAGARWDRDGKCWNIPASPDALAQLKRAIGVRADVQADDATAEVERAAAIIAGAAVHKSADDLPPVPVSKTDAWKHQRQAFWFARELPAALLAMDMGTGKSKVAVDLIVNDGDMKVLIVAPLSVVRVWPKQFRIHAGREVRVVPLLSGTTKRKMETAQQALADGERDGVPVVIVVNYETLRMAPFGPTTGERGRIKDVGWAASVRWDRFIMDESHRAKDASTQTARACARVAASAKRRLALTGTPMGNGPLDIFGQYRAINPDIFGVSFPAFQRRYAVMGGYGGYQVLRYQNEDELNAKIYSIAYRVTKDVLDLPPVSHEQRVVTLSPAARRAYDEMDKDFMASLAAFADKEHDGDGDAERITATIVLTKLLRLQQITSGHLPDDTGAVHTVDTAKADALKDLLADLPPREPVVVFTRFVHDLDAVARVCEAAGRRYGELSGRRKDLTADSTMPDDVDVLAVQLQSGGVGIDLTRARYAVYYSVGHSLLDYDQSLARVHRPGQTRETFYYHIVAEGTIDEAVYDALRNKRDVIESVLTDRSGEQQAEDDPHGTIERNRAWDDDDDVWEVHDSPPGSIDWDDAAYGRGDR